MTATYVGTSEGLFVITGDGAHQLADQPVTALTTSPSVGGEACYALTYDGAVLDVAPTSATQRPVTPAGIDTDPTCLAVLGGEADHRLVVGTTEAHLLVGHAEPDGGWRLELVPSFDAIGERDTWTQPWGAPGDVRSLAVLPPSRHSATSSLLVNVHVGGVLRAEDDELRSWTQLVDVGVDVHQVAVCPPDTIVVATGAAGFGISRDRGESWSFSSKGLHGSYCRAVAVLGDEVLVSASTGPSSSDGRLYRRLLDDDEARFEHVTGGLPPSFDGNVDSGSVGTDVDHRLVALAGPDGTVFASDDGARSWAKVGDVPGYPRAILLA